MKRTLLAEALTIAREKLPRHPMLHRAYTHFSFVVRDGSIVEWGTNNPGVPPIHFGYGKRARGWDKGYQDRTHAELDAFRRARGLLRGDSFDMINIRLNPSGILRNSCPCPICSQWLAEVGCRRVAFTTDSGWAETLT